MIRQLLESFCVAKVTSLWCYCNSGWYVCLIGLSNRSNWPRHYGDYVKCVLFKENKDTMQAVNILAKMLR